MKSNLAICLFLAYAFVVCGCAIKPNESDLSDDKKNGLLLIEDKGMCQEVKTGKMWQVSKEGPFSSLEEADRYATDLKLGGYDDWRLPTKSELFHLFHMCYSKNNGDCVMNHRGEFWAVSEDQAPSLGHWETYQLCGPEFKFVKSIKDDGFVRAIRP